MTPAPPVPMTIDEIEAYVIASAHIPGLRIAEAHLKSVAEHFAVTAQMAHLVLSFPLPDEAGLAPVFVP
jgi:hypothetical protein